MTRWVLVLVGMLAGGAVGAGPAPGAPGDPLAYHPSGVGDTWTYESSVRGVFTNEVLDASAANGAVVHRVRSTDEAGGEQMLAVRHEGSRVYIGPEGGPGVLLADFGLDVGSSVVDEARGATVTLRAHHEELDVFGARFADVMEVEHTLPTGGTHTYFFARDVGLVGNASTAPDTQVRLVEATVDGRTVRAGEG